MLDCLSHSSAIVGLHVVEDTTVRLVLTEWLSVVAHHLDLDSCILSGVATLRVSRLAKALCCPLYSMLHLFCGEFITQKYINHTSTHCPTVFA